MDLHQAHVNVRAPICSVHTEYIVAGEHSSPSCPRGYSTCTKVRQKEHRTSSDQILPLRTYSVINVAESGSHLSLDAIQSRFLNDGSHPVLSKTSIASLVSPAMSLPPIGQDRGVPRWIISIRINIDDWNIGSWTFALSVLVSPRKDGAQT